MITSLTSCNAPELALHPLKQQHDICEHRTSAWFTNANHFKQATNDALQAREDALQALAAPRTWHAEATRAKYEQAASAPAAAPPPTPDMRNHVGEGRRFPLATSASDDEKRIEKMKALAELCAKEGKHELAAQVLLLWARFLARFTRLGFVWRGDGVDDDGTEDDGWDIKEGRLAIARELCGGSSSGQRLPAPWPATLQVLAQQSEDADLRREICKWLTEGREETAFKEQVEVRSWVINATGRGRWEAGTLKGVRPTLLLRDVTSDERKAFDVKLRDGKTKTEQLERKTLVVSDSGAGALLRVASRAGNVELVQELLEHKVSCFEADHGCSTALHEAACSASGAAANAGRICEMLLERHSLEVDDVESLFNQKHESPFDLAKQRCNMAVVRAFRPSISDKHCKKARTHFAGATDLLSIFCCKAADGDHESVAALLQLASRCAEPDDVVKRIKGMTTIFDSATVHGSAVQALLEGFVEHSWQSSSASPPPLSKHPSLDQRLAESRDGALETTPGTQVRAFLSREKHRKSTFLSREADDTGSGPIRITPLMLASRGGLHVTYKSTDGHLTTVRRLLDSKADPYTETRDNNGCSALSMAAETGCKQIMQLLLDQILPSVASDASPNTVKAKRLCNFALKEAVTNGHVECASLLLQQRSREHSSISDGNDSRLREPDNSEESSPSRLKRLSSQEYLLQKRLVNEGDLLVAAAENGHVEVCELLLARGPDVNEARKKDGRTALMAACESGHIACVMLLLKHDTIEVDKANSTHRAGRTPGQTALMYAARHNHEKCLELLLEHKADANAQQPDRGTALMYAALNGHEGVARRLLAAKADLRQQQVNGRTVLMAAVQKGHESCCGLLLKEHGKQSIDIRQERVGVIWLELGVQPDKANELECPKLRDALVEKLLREADLSWSKESFEREFFSFDLLEKDHFIAVELVEKDTTGSSSSSIFYYRPDFHNHWTVLHDAARAGDPGCMLLLLQQEQHKSDVNVLTADGKTPLMVACKHGNRDIVKLLLVRGADCTLKDAAGQDALAIAKQQQDEQKAGHTSEPGKEGIVSMLRKKIR